MEIYDLIILGGGPGGYLAAERASSNGLKTILFEKRSLGGVCLNEGCIPTKTLLNSAKHYAYAKESEAFGVVVNDARLDHAKVIERKNQVVEALVSGVEAKMRACKITVVREFAKIVGKTSEGLFSISANGEIYCAKKLIIATGSSPAVPQIPGIEAGLDSGFVMTSREILDIMELPKRLVIIGGGVVGLEMAAYFTTAGSHVTVIEALKKIAGSTDSEISSLMQKELKRKGVEFCVGAVVTNIRNNEVTYQKDESINTIIVDKVLLSVGRNPTVQGIGLENLDIYVEKGAIVTDEHLRTNVPDVYAVGDVNGKYMLAHTAYREAEVAVNHILGKRDYMRYTAIPSVIYTTPEAASVGETEDMAKQRGVDVEVVRVSALYSGRYLAETCDESGICKVVVEKKSRKILGVHMLLPYASEIIYGMALAIEMRLTVEEMRELIFPHPTVGELIREGLFMI